MVKVTQLMGNNGQIKGLPANPRTISEYKKEQLRQSLQDDPEMLELRELVVVPHGDKFVVIMGNKRLSVLLERGDIEVPCKVLPADTPPSKLQAYTIKDNVPYGEWDLDMLSAEWDMVQLKEYGLDLDFTSMFDEEQGEEQTFDRDDEYEVPEPDAVEKISTSIVAGDVIQVGRHVLVCGDSTTIEPYEKIGAVLGDGVLAAMIVTDPPYNVAYKGIRTERDAILNDDMSDSNFYQFLYDAFTAMQTILSAGGGVYVWHASSNVREFSMAFADAGIVLRQQLIWKKSHFVMGRQDYQWIHEPCLYGWKEGAHKFYGDRKQATVFECKKPQKSELHPTTKPTELFSWHIELSSLHGEWVLDPFGGSGTTMVCCEVLGRRGALIELDPRYCQTIVTRMLNTNPELPVMRNGQVWDGKS